MRSHLVSCTGLLALLLAACGVAAPQAVPSTPSPTTAAVADEPLPVVRIVCCAGALGGAGTALAIAQGYFEQAGVAVETVDFNGDQTQQFPALLTGNVDVVGNAISPGLLNLAARSVAVKIVASQARNDPGASAVSLVVRTQLLDSGRLKSYADLKGLKIAVSGQGSPAEFALAKVLADSGNALSDVERITMDFPSSAPALANGAIDAAFLPEPFATRAVQQGIGVKWRTVGDMDPGSQNTVIQFSPRLAANHDLAVRYMIGYLRGVREYNDAFFKNIHRAQTVQQLIKMINVTDPKLYDAMEYPAIDPNGKVNVASMQDQLRWYRQMGYVGEQVDLSALYDPSIAEAAVARLGEYR
jgi:NitT/TauT family transport system substrate-binding protein